MWPRVRRARAAPPGSARWVRPRGQADSFFGRVYMLVRRIPPGQRATYGQIARLLRSPRSARIVGWAMHSMPKGSGVPWHRVVQQGGSLSPAVSPAAPSRQRRLLEREGVTFRLDGRIDMARHQWSPPVAGAW